MIASDSFSPGPTLEAGTLAELLEYQEVKLGELRFEPQEARFRPSLDEGGHLLCCVEGRDPIALGASPGGQGLGQIGLPRARVAGHQDVPWPIDVLATGQFCGQTVHGILQTSSVVTKLSVERYRPMWQRDASTRGHRQLARAANPSAPTVALGQSLPRQRFLFRFAHRIET